MSNIGAYALLELIADRVSKKWSAKVKVIVAENPAHGIELLTSAKNATCVIFYVSDSAQGVGIDALDTGVSALIRFGLVRVPGMGVKGRKPPKVLQDVDSLRKFMGGIDAVFADLLGDGWLEYKGMTYLATEKGRLLNGYALTYSPVYAYEV